MSLTPQAAFNKVARHLLRQNEVSTDEHGSGLYRGPRGLRCAIGALIPKRITPPECAVELLLDSTSRGGHSATIEYFGGADNCRALLPLLGDLQEVHDAYKVGEWRSALVRVAREHNLSAAVLEAAP